MSAAEGLSEAVILVFAGAATLLIAYALSRLAATAGLLPDRPNGRSNHETVTPRSGGAAIYLAWAIGLLGAAFVAGWGEDAAMAGKLAALAGGVFAFGLIDDRFGLSALIKLGVQIAAAIGFVLIFSPLEIAPLPFVGETDLGVLAAPVTIFWIVAFMNAYNFMDGVDGIAASCGALALFALALAAASAGALFWAVAALFAGLALCGFLPLNFPRARLFMGDNGSQTIGFLIAAIAVGAANATGGATSALFVPVLMAPFIVDVAFTIAHRLARGENVLSAHREHAYQLLVRMGRAQTGVVATYLALTAFSVAAATAMLRIAPEFQWLVLALLAGVLTPSALRLYRRAQREGLLSPDADNADPLPAYAPPSDQRADGARDETGVLRDISPPPAARVAE